jgi:hypothetical protein
VAVKCVCVCDCETDKTLKHIFVILIVLLQNIRRMHTYINTKYYIKEICLIFYIKSIQRNKNVMKINTAVLWLLQRLRTNGLTPWSLSPC